MAIKQFGGLMAAVVGAGALMLANPVVAGAAQSCTVTPQSTVGCDYEDFNGHHHHHHNGGFDGGGGNNNGGGGGNNGGGGTPAPTTFSAPPATGTGVPLRCGPGQTLQYVTIDDPATPAVTPDHFVTAGNINPLYAIPSGTTPAGVFVQAPSDLAASTGAPVNTGNIVAITCA